MQVTNHILTVFVSFSLGLGLFGLYGFLRADEAAEELEEGVDDCEAD